MRHRIARQIRHSLSQHLSTFPNGALVVVRALPSSALIGGHGISNELAEVLPQLIKKIEVVR